jgi:dolichol kinase
MKILSQFVSSVAFVWFGIFQAGRLHGRAELHLARKIWHAAMGTLIVGIYLFSGISTLTAVGILASVLVADLVLEFSRLRNPALNQAFVKASAPFMRKCEINRISGIPYYVASAGIAIAVFPKEIAALSILFLAWGDPIASAFGILWGDRSIRFSNGKSLIGTLAGVVTCAIVAAAFLGAYSFLPHQYVVLVLVGAIAGGTAELLPLQVDDNLSIPLVSGFALGLAYLALGIAL